MLLIFDCDGVVIDSMSIHNEVEAEFYREIGIHMSPAEIGKRFSGVAQDEILATFQKETGFKIPADFETRIDQRKETVFSQQLKAIDGMHDVLETLHGIPRCIASGARLDQVKHNLTITNLYDEFAPYIYSAEQVSRGKPAPDLFLYAAKQMGQTQEDCLVIEDAVAGVQAARAAGMKVFGFIGGSHCDEGHGAHLVNAGADLFFSSMQQLPGLLKSPELKKA